MINANVTAANKALSVDRLGFRPLQKSVSSPQISENKEYKEIPKKKLPKCASVNDLVRLRRQYVNIVKDTPVLAWPGISQRVTSFIKLTEIPEAELTPEINELLLVKDKYTSGLVVAILHGVMGAFLYGYNITCLNTIQTTLQKNCCESYVSNTKFGIISSMYMVGGFVGAMLGGRLSDRFGRKKFLLGTDIIAIIGAVMFYFVSKTNSFYLFLGTRFVLGVGGGGTTAAIPPYLGEISPASIRGAIGTLYQLAITIGCLGGYLVSKPLENSWGFVGTANLILPVLQFSTVCFFPESPVWLYSRCKDEKAVKILRKLRGYENVEFELNTYTRVRKKTNDNLEEILLNPEDSMPKRSLCGTRSIRKAFIISCVLSAVQQFAGINAVMQYSGAMFSSAGFSNVFLANVLVGTFNVLGVIIAIPLMDRLGRRVLLMLSIAVMFVSCIAISYTRTEAVNTTNPWGMLTVIIALIYVVGFELGVGPIPWLIVAEICPTSHRGQIMGMAAGMNWLANLVISFGYNPVAEKINNWVWYIFAGVLIVGCIFVVTTVPETKGKRPHEVEAILQGFNQRDQPTQAHSKYILNASAPIGDLNHPTTRADLV